MEHRFTTPKDNFVNAVVLSKTRLINCKVDDVMAELLSPSVADAEGGDVKKKPEVPEDVAKWIESNEISSAKLKAACWHQRQQLSGSTEAFVEVEEASTCDTTDTSNHSYVPLCRLNDVTLGFEWRHTELCFGIWHAGGIA